MKKFKFDVDGESKEFVALSDHNETMANVRTNATKGLIDPNSEDYTNLVSELQNYKTKEFKGNVFGTHFNDFKVKNDYKEDVLKLAGITPDMDDKTIKSTMNAFVKEEKNSVYLDQEDNNNQTNNSDPVLGKTKTNNGGGGFWG